MKGVDNRFIKNLLPKTSFDRGLMRFLLLSFLAISFLLYVPIATADTSDDDQSSFNNAYDSITAFLKEIVVKFVDLTDEEEQTLDELIASGKELLNDPDPAANVPVEGDTKKQWDEYNTSSPELEKRNRQLEEDNRKLIDSM